MDDTSFPSFKNEQIRVVLFPHGPPSNEAVRQACNELLIYCGADFMRMIDQKFAGSNRIERFARYIAHLDRKEMAASIVVLTQTNPVAICITGDRVRLCSKYPELDMALWCIMMDAETDPFVWENLSRAGQMIGHPKQAPIFTDQHGLQYLLLVTKCETPEVVRTNAQQMQKNSRNKYVDYESPTKRHGQGR